jgi:hypothetical protein
MTPGNLSAMSLIRKFEEIKANVDRKEYTNSCKQAEQRCRSAIMSRKSNLAKVRGKIKN